MNLAKTKLDELIETLNATKENSIFSEDLKSTLLNLAMEAKNEEIWLNSRVGKLQKIIDSSCR